jgi:hypothetical protein
MKYKVLRWDYLNNIRTRLERNIKFLKSGEHSLDKDWVSERLLEDEKDLIEIRFSIKELEKQKDNG